MSLKDVRNFLLITIFSAHFAHAIQSNHLTTCLGSLSQNGFVVPDEAAPTIGGATLKQLATKTAAFQEEMRQRWSAKWDEVSGHDANLYTVSNSAGTTRIIAGVQINRIVDSLPRSDKDKAAAKEILNNLLKNSPGRIRSFDLWLNDVSKRAPDDQNNLIFEAVQADAMIRNNPNLEIDMGVDVDAKKAGVLSGHTSKTLDLFVYDESLNVFYKVEVKSIQDRSKPYDAIGSFVQKSLEVAAQEETPSLKMLALYTEFPQQRDRTTGIREVVDEFGVLRRYKILPNGTQEELKAENLILNPIQRSLEGHEKNGSTHVIFGIDALDRRSTARNRLYRDEEGWQSTQDHWDREVFLNN